MLFNDPLPPPVSMMSSPLAVVDVRELRAALRLVLGPGDADEAARRLPDDSDLEDLGAVVGVPDSTRLGEGSAASRDGAYLTLDDLSVGSPLVWETAGDDTQRLWGSIEDAIWLPATRGLLSMSGGREDSRSASRLSVLASTNPYALLALELIQFDPIAIADDRDRRYAAPPGASGRSDA